MGDAGLVGATGSPVTAADLRHVRPVVRKTLSGWSWFCPGCDWAELGFATMPIAFQSARRHAVEVCLDYQALHLHAVPRG